MQTTCLERLLLEGKLRAHSKQSFGKGKKERGESEKAQADMATMPFKKISKSMLCRAGDNRRETLEMKKRTSGQL